MHNKVFEPQPPEEAMKMIRQRPDCNLEECICNLEYYHLSADPDPLFWIQEIGIIAVEGGRKAESFLAKLIRESPHANRRAMAYAFLQNVTQPTAFTLMIMYDFQRDVADMGNAIEISIGQKMAPA